MVNEKILGDLITVRMKMNVSDDYGVLSKKQQEAEHK